MFESKLKGMCFAFCVAMALVVALAPAVSAQSAGSGTVQGRVTDQTGAVIAGAKVTIRNVGTNVTRSLETDEDGNYRAQLLQPGLYEVSASATGFATTKRPNIDLVVGSTATVNFDLKVSGAESVITVTDTAPITEPERAEVTNVVGERQVSELPINGRRWDGFVLLTPGVSPDGTFGAISVRGISGLLNNNTVDGADNNQAFFSEAKGRTRVSYTISQSSIKEFQVGLSSFSAEFGRAAGGTINAITRSGTNEVHGEVFYYIRDDKFQAREPTLQTPSGAAVKNADRRQQYGFSLGMPIIKDKVLFYGVWDQQLRSEQYLTSAFGGTFFTNFMSECLTAPTGATASPAAPLANCQAVFDFFVDQAGQTPRKRRNNVALGKIDWNVNQNNIFTGSYNWHRWVSPNGIQTQQVVTRGPSDNGLDGVKTDSFIARLNSVINSRMVNEAKFLYGRDFEFQQGNSTDPRTTITNGISFGMSEFLPRPKWPDEHRYQWTDTFSWIAGRNSWKFGADINYVRDRTQNIFQGGGTFAYQDISVTGQNVIEGNAALALDCPPGSIAFGCVQVADGARTGKHYSSLTQAFDLRVGGNNGDLFFTTTDWNFFVQNTFKWTPRLTMNAGMRYEYQSMPKVPEVTVTLPGGSQLTTVGFPGQSFTPETQTINKDTNNFGPRLAFAYDVNGDARDVLRFGGGVYYGRTPNALIRSHILENGVALPQFFLNFDNTGLGPNPVYQTLLTSVPSTVSARSINFMAGDYVRAFISMLDVAYEREIARNISASVTYLYTRGNHLTHANDINLNNPTATVQILFDADGSNGTTNDRTLLTTTPFYSGSRPMCDTLVNAQSATCATRLRRVLRQTSDFNSTYQAVVLQLNVRNRWGFTQTAHFTYASAKDDGQAMGASPFAGSFESLFDPRVRSREYSRSDFDMQRRFVWHFIWQPDQVWSAGTGARRHALGDWSFNGIVTAQGGQPFQPNISGTISTAAAFGPSDNGSVNGSGGSLRIPWVERNPLDTTGFFVIDFRVQKDVSIMEGKKLRFLVEAFNLLNRTNHPNRFNFSNTAYRVQTSVNPGVANNNTRQVVIRQDSTFAGVMDPISAQGDLSLCTRANCLSSASGVFFGPRDMQFGMKFIF